MTNKGIIIAALIIAVPIFGVAMNLNGILETATDRTKCASLMANHRDDAAFASKRFSLPLEEAERYCMLLRKW